MIGGELTLTISKHMQPLRVIANPAVYITIEGEPVNLELKKKTEKINNNTYRNTLKIFSTQALKMFALNLEPLRSVFL